MQRLKIKGRKKILHENRNEKKVGVPTFISNRMSFKTKPVMKTKKGVA